MYTVLESIATTNPPFKFGQADFAKFMTKVQELPKSLRKRMSQIHNLSGIDYRYSCIEDYGQEESENFSFFPKNWSLSPFPTTAQRNQKYQECVLDLAVQAVQFALWDADIPKEEITHLIVVSCTGFFAPGLDIHVTKELGFNPNIDRTVIGFMGCHAALNGLKVAHNICQNNPEARVVLICAELCTLHFQFGNTLQNAVSNSLFSDGVAAVILASRPFEEAENKLAYTNGSCALHPDSIDHLSWNIVDTGFLVELSRQVPQVIANCLPSYIEKFLSDNSLSLEELDFCAMHPGGRQIVEQAQASLGLSRQMLEDSYEILRLYGNMSSATILFILKRILDRHQASIREKKSGYSSGAVLTFGPGLTIEGCLLRKV